MILAIAGYVKIYMPVVVIVARGHAHAITITFQPCAFSCIFKTAIGLLVIEAVPIFWVTLVGYRSLGHWIFQQRAVREKYIHATIIVIVKDRNAAAHRLKQVLDRRRRTGMFKIDLGQCGDVGKGH